MENLNPTPATKLQNTIKSVNDAPTSIFTKADVLAILNNIEGATAVPQKSELEIQKEFAEKLKATLKRHIREVSLGSDYVDFSTAEFSINYSNHVELDSVEIEEDRVIDEFETCVITALDEVINDLEDAITDEVIKETEEAQA